MLIFNTQNLKMKIKNLLITFGFCSILLQLCFSQNIFVQLNSGNIIQYPFGDVKTITFSGNALNINKTSSITDTKPLGDICKISFGNLITSLPDIITESNALFSVYPNPSHNTCTVITSAETKQIRILNAFGQPINTVNTQGSTSLELKIQTPGFYFLQFVTGNQIITKKILIVK